MVDGEAQKKRKKNEIRGDRLKQMAREKNERNTQKKNEYRPFPN